MKKPLFLKKQQYRTLSGSACGDDGYMVRKLQEEVSEQTARIYYDMMRQGALKPNRPLFVQVTITPC